MVNPVTNTQIYDYFLPLQNFPAIFRSLSFVLPNSGEYSNLINKLSKEL